MSKMVYQFKNGFPKRGLDAQRVGESLSRLEKQHGKLIPATVVEEARPASSPLHGAFDWDDTVAAQNWRLDQAKSLIRSVEIVSAPIGPVPKDLRAFVSVPPKDSGDGRQYENIVRVMSDSEKRARLLKQAYAELVAWRNRYRILVEFAEIFEVIDDIELVDPVHMDGVDPKDAGKAV